MAVTAKVKCVGKNYIGNGPDVAATIEFQPDYQDGRNKEWAEATPALNFSMTVKGEVTDQFEPGVAYTLTIEKSQD